MRNTKVKQKDNRQPGPVDKSRGTAGKKRVKDWWAAWEDISMNRTPGEKQGQTVWHTGYKNAWKWVWLMASDCHHQPQSGIAPKHQDEQSDKVLIPAACQRLCSSRKTIGAKETATEAVNFHSQGLFSVYPHPSPCPGAIFSSYPPSPTRIQWHKPSAERTLRSFLCQLWSWGAAVIVAIKAILVLIHTNTQKRLLVH